MKGETRHEGEGSGAADAQQPSRVVVFEEAVQEGADGLQADDEGGEMKEAEAAACSAFPDRE